MNYSDQYDLGDSLMPQEEEWPRGMISGLQAHFDPHDGGMQKAPKFPMPSIWSFLLAVHHHRPSEGLEQQLKLTLDKMALGGIYDQLGGGFARYSVDEKWFAPHFEKMLYDNAQLISLYAHAYQVFSTPLYREVVENTIGFLEREMLSPEGGFYAALDADSEGEEGRYYTWNKAELCKIVGEDAELVCDVFGITENGNWEQGLNILHRPLPLADHAARYSIKPRELEERIDAARLKLMKARDERVRPGLDDKVLAGWNAMTINGLVDAYHAIGDQKYLDLALRNAAFLVNNMVVEDRVFRNYKHGEVGIMGTLEDYAFMIRAALALYQAVHESGWLTLAEKLTRYVIDHFYDPAEELFFFTDSSAESLIARKKELFDNVIPSSNAVMAVNLLQLGALTYEEAHLRMARQMTARIYKLLDQNARHLSHWGYALLLQLAPVAEIAIVGDDHKELARDLQKVYHPAKVVAAAKEPGAVPLLEGKVRIEGRSTIYVCFDKTCKLPVHSADEAIKQILGPYST
jgi:uncharacterized protein YyaL (SSP411 family)